MKQLTINDDGYLIDNDELSNFAHNFKVDLDKYTENVMNYFCDWLINNINDL